MSFRSLQAWVGSRLPALLVHWASTRDGSHAVVPRHATLHHTLCSGRKVKDAILG
jgi:hypothetical protein